MREPWACCTLSSALRSPNGTLTKSPGSSLKPRRTAGPSLADKVPSVRPWKAFSITTTSGCSMPLCQPCKPREFQRSFVGFGPGVVEERPIHARQLRQLLRQALLPVDAVQVGGVQQQTGLFADGRRRFSGGSDRHWSPPRRPPHPGIHDRPDPTGACPGPC